MESKVASGYVVLMGAYPSSDKNKNKNKEESKEENEKAAKLDRGAINLAFLALTEGNVIDACFGVKAHVGASNSNPRHDRAMKVANDAKSMLNEAVRSSDGVKAIAVEAYGNAFHIIMSYNEDVSALNCFTRCFKWKSIHDRAEESLRAAFRPLVEAIHAAS